MTNFLATLLACCCFTHTLSAQLPKLPTDTGKPTDIVFIGSSHFGQQAMYSSGPGADLFSPQRQQELVALRAQLAKFKPDLILIEREPAVQASTDSLYNAYRTGELEMTRLEYGRSEQYQLGFALARQLGHERVLGADHYESVSTRMMKEGENVAAFTAGLDSFSALGRRLDAQLSSGQLSLKNYLLFLNRPDVLDYTFQVLFVNALRVRNGRFTNPNPTYVDTAFVQPAQIGAEFVSVFMEREWKIYSNIVALQAATKARRILVIMGHRHAAVLPKLMQPDPAFRVVPLGRVLR
jgi:hypothetical protein